MITVKPTLNAKVAAGTLMLGAVLLHLINQLEHSILPIRLLTSGILIMGAWSFSDEMGMEKPLNRAAFICFVFSMLALTVVNLHPEGPDITQYYLIYALSLLFAVLIWSGAYLHRQRNLRIIGTIGVAASLLPIMIIVAGHISVGAAGVFGVSALLGASNGDTLLGSTPVNTIEVIFLGWTLATAVFLLRGQIAGVVDATKFSKQIT